MTSALLTVGDLTILDDGSIEWSGAVSGPSVSDLTPGSAPTTGPAFSASGELDRAVAIGRQAVDFAERSGISGDLGAWLQSSGEVAQQFSTIGDHLKDVLALSSSVAGLAMPVIGLAGKLLTLGDDEDQRLDRLAQRIIDSIVANNVDLYEDDRKTRFAEARSVFRGALGFLQDNRVELDRIFGRFAERHEGTFTDDPTRPLAGDTKSESRLESRLFDHLAESAATLERVTGWVSDTDMQSKRRDHLRALPWMQPIFNPLDSSGLAAVWLPLRDEMRPLATRKHRPNGIGVNTSELGHPGTMWDYTVWGPVLITAISSHLSLLSVADRLYPLTAQHRSVLTGAIAALREVAERSVTCVRVGAVRWQHPVDAGPRYLVAAIDLCTGLSRLAVDWSPPGVDLLSPDRAARRAALGAAAALLAEPVPYGLRPLGYKTATPGILGLLRAVRSFERLLAEPVRSTMSLARFDALQLRDATWRPETASTLVVDGLGCTRREFTGRRLGVRRRLRQRVEVPAQWPERPAKGVAYELRLIDLGSRSPQSATPTSWITLARTTGVTDALEDRELDDRVTRDADDVMTVEVQARTFDYAIFAEPIDDPRIALIEQRGAWWNDAAARMRDAVSAGTGHAEPDQVASPAGVRIALEEDTATATLALAISVNHGATRPLETDPDPGWLVIDIEVVSGARPDGVAPDGVMNLDHLTLEVHELAPARQLASSPLPSPVISLPLVLVQVEDHYDAAAGAAYVDCLARQAAMAEELEQAGERFEDIRVEPWDPIEHGGVGDWYRRISAHPGFDDELGRLDDGLRERLREGRDRPIN